jgi:hypothetical protein
MIRMSSLLFYASVLLLAVALTFLKIPVASSQGPTLVAERISEALPTRDPDSALWKQASVLEVPLSAQSVTKPILPQTNIKSLTARALHNDTQMAILIEWADTSKNDDTVRVQDFRDAVAIQFPLGTGQPFICMGQLDGNVNIWQWKADWQADLNAREDMETLYPNMNVDQYPFATGAMPAPKDYTDPNYVPALAAKNLSAAVHVSPVEELNAGGFGTLTSKAADRQSVQGYGVWSDGKWRVIFSRSLAAKDADSAKFEQGKLYGIAFAAWDGANAERNGQKSTSNWVSLQVASPAAVAAPGPTVMFTLLILVVIVGAALVFRMVGGRGAVQ